VSKDMGVQCDVDPIDTTTLPEEDMNLFEWFMGVKREDIYKIMFTTVGVDEELHEMLDTLYYPVAM
jgi:hypothetical protein